MRLIQTILVYIIIISSAYAQATYDFQILTEAEIPNAKITRTSYFDGNALWGLIDGGADVYLEYGFDKLLLQEIEWNENKFRVEIYKMSNAQAAFGIFSISRHRCAKNDTLTKFICITPYQVQSALGKHYISIANEKGSTEAQNLTVDIFTKVLAKINEAAYIFPAIFQKKIYEPYKDQFKFFKGKLGLQNGFPLWSDAFEDFSNYEIFLLPIEREDGYIFAAQIKFGSEEDLHRFKRANSTDSEKGIITIEVLSPKEILFIESTLPEAEIGKILKN